MSRDKIIRVGYCSPGWPISDFPNGIVSYIENIIQGMPNSVQYKVIANNLLDSSTEDYVVDLSSYDNKYINWKYKLYVKILSKLRYSGIAKNNYIRNIKSYSCLLLEVLDDIKPELDILEVEESFGLSYHAVEKMKCPLVTRLHGPWFTMKDIFNLTDDESYKFRVFYEGQSIEHSQGITSPSMDVLEKVREYYNLELPYGEVIPNPVPIIAENHQWQLSVTNPYVLFVGRFDEHKGGDLIIDAFNIIAQQEKGLELYFVGPDRGFDLNGKTLSIEEYIGLRIKKESIRHRIKLFGQCGSEQIQSLRSKARVTVCCSRYENFPVSLLEALASGCPVVATSVGGIKEIISDGFNGLFAEPESAESIAEKVTLLLHSKEKSEQFSKNAIDDSIKRFSPEVVAQKTINYYKKVLSHSAN